MSESRKTAFCPIVLTQEGDTLACFKRSPLTQPCPSNEDFPCHDENKLADGYQVGTHTVCSGAIHRVKSSASYHALLCEKCKLRISIPSDIQTYASLRTHFHNLLSANETRFSQTA